MTEAINHAAMLWSGGKDGALALYLARQAGYRVRALVTFAPPQADFLAHPLPLIQLQAQALGLPYRLEIVHAPFDAGYEAALVRLRDELGIATVITGDIDRVNGQPNWIGERSRAVGMQVHTPLWGRERADLLRQWLDLGFLGYFSCIDTQKLRPDWLGRTLNADAVAALQTIRQQNGLDLCGENGEYHSMVLGGPMFGHRIALPAWSPRQIGSLLGMRIDSIGPAVLSSPICSPAQE